MNKFIGIGRLTNNIEIKQTSNGKNYIKNSIAIKNDFKNSDGEYGTEFINIVIWGKTAEIIGTYATKGTLISIEGRLTTRDYEKNDGTKGYISEIICEKVKILDSKKKDTNKDNSNSDEYDPYSEFGESVDIDDNFLE